MSDRTYGQTVTCSGCRYWSEMLAKAGGDIEGVVAMCINSKSPLYQDYTQGDGECGQWKSGYDGAIDEPRSDPLRYKDES